MAAFEKKLSDWFQTKVVDMMEKLEWDEARMMQGIETYIKGRQRSKDQREEQREFKEFKKEKDAEFQQWMKERGTSGSKLVTGSK